jgi:transcriptional regulator with XRE-family HTH domain
MTKTLEQKMASMSPVRRRKVEARTTELIAEEQSLRDLRRALTRTQERMAKDLGIGQESVSRLEQRSDLLISTLRGYVEALGGSLRLVAEFPNRPPVILNGLAAVADRTRAKTREKGRK